MSILSLSLSSRGAEHVRRTWHIQRRRRLVGSYTAMLRAALTAGGWFGALGQVWRRVE